MDIQYCNVHVDKDDDDDDNDDDYDDDGGGGGGSGDEDGGGGSGDDDVDNDGDALEDITFQFEFTTTTKNSSTFLYNTGPITVAAGGNDYDNLNVVQRYKVTRVDGDRRIGKKTVIADGLLCAPWNVGPKSIPNYQALADAAT